MKKRLIDTSSPPPSHGSRWLSLDELAEVEITSEASAHPIEAALLPGHAEGWRAAAPGEQVIRVNFEEPQQVRHVRVVIEEHERTRTQEFVLRAASEPRGPWREVARQQFNFSPAGATREQEDYRLELPTVAALELKIVPDISGGDACASLRELRVGT